MKTNILAKITKYLVYILYWFFMTILGPMILLLNILDVKGNEPPTWSLGIGLCIIAIVPILCVIFNIDTTKIDTWLEQNFGQESLTLNKETFSEYNHNKNVQHIPNSSYKTHLSDYVEKETNKIIKENHITNNIDKKAAEFVAINNIQHSPEKLSKIFDTTIDKAKDIEESIGIEEEKRVSNHISYEGRITAKDKNRMKALLGYKCTACGADMSETYGNIGHNYIELHHKIPYSKIKENETRTLTENEFCVLCPNCHRMIHKLPDAGDIDLLSRIIKLNKKN